MINIEKFQSEIQKNMQAMVNEHKKIIKENHQLKVKVEELEKQASTVSVAKTDKEAVVIFAADISGSMASWEKRMGKDYTEKLLATLNDRYKFVSTRYIHHSTEAQVVSEKNFLGVSDGGGTIVSSAYRLINKELEDFDYDSDKLDVFVVHISDGDNLSSDNARVVRMIEKILKKNTKLIYLEVNQYNRQSTLLHNSNGLKYIIDGVNFDFGIIHSEKDVDRLIESFTEMYLN